jgi:hypothetical protein
MPKVQEQGNSIPSSLHYALTDSQCIKCGAQLEWKAKFDDVSSPKYTAKHCNQDYLITIESVKVEMVTQSTGPQMSGKKEEGTQQQQHIEEDVQQSKAIAMAEELKYKASLQKKAKLGDGSNIAAEDR